MPRVDALITPLVLAWARERSGLTIVQAAAKADRPAEDLVAWETGQKRPTIAQARKLSKVYKRPLAIFYMPEPPKEFETLRDYRRLPEKAQRDFGPELLEVVRLAAEHQLWASEFLDEEGVPPVELVGFARIGDDPYEVADRIRKLVGVDVDEQVKCRNRYDALRLWLASTEAGGVFVFRRGGIDLGECRGFVISDAQAPFAFINSEDAYVGQLFTLAHELVHLSVSESGISNMESKGRYAFDDASAIESFCNRVAAETLVERHAFESAWQDTSPSSSIEDRISEVSRYFKVSEEVIARRLLDRGSISTSQYEDLRVTYRQRWLELKTAERARAKVRGGGPSYYRTMVTQNGLSFTQTVLGAYFGGRITGRTASGLLNVKVNNLSKLAEIAAVSTRGL